MRSRFAIIVLALASNLAAASTIDCSIQATTGLPAYTRPVEGDVCNFNYNKSTVWQLGSDSTYIPPGSVVCLASGIYESQVAIASKRGTAAQPIYILPLNANNRPKLKKGLLIRDDSFLYVAGLEIRNAKTPLIEGDAAILIDTCRAETGGCGTVHTEERTHDITIASVTAEDSHHGIIATQVGAAINIYDSFVRNNIISGISYANTFGGVGDTESVVAGNWVDNNDGYGIQLVNAPNIYIEKNTVTCSGQAKDAKKAMPLYKCAANAAPDYKCPIGGYSGIHIESDQDYGIPTSTRRNSRSATLQQAGTSQLSTTPEPTANVSIRYNKVAGSRDRNTGGTTSDGNGIQVDHFSDNNTVAFNAIWDNDGAGISVLA